MNDSRDAWEYPAPDLASAGIAVFSPDQRGFGTTPDRGLWAGGHEMADDARQMAQSLRARYPHTRLILMGESMGAAVLMVLAAEPNPPPVDGYVLIAPAVWGRAEMNVFLRAGLWLLSHTVPSMTVDRRWHRARQGQRQSRGDPPAVGRSADHPCHAVGHDPRPGGPDGLCARRARRMFHGPALFLYGGHDELIPMKATAATWRALPAGVREAYYPAGYHLLMRDHERITPIEDTIAWILHPDAPLPSGADRAAAAWLAEQPPQ